MPAGRPKTPTGHTDDAMMEFLEFSELVAEFTRLMQKHHRIERDMQIAHYREKRDLITAMDDKLRKSQFSYACADEMRRILAQMQDDEALS